MPEISIKPILDALASGKADVDGERLTRFHVYADGLNLHITLGDEGSMRSDDAYVEYDDGRESHDLTDEECDAVALLLVGRGRRYVEVTR